MYKDKAEFLRAYATCIEMTDQYNKEHSCNVLMAHKEDEDIFCHTTPSLLRHEVTSFPLNYLYDTQTNHHRPVFIGDKLFHIPGKRWEYITAYHTSEDINSTNFSWHEIKKQSFILISEQTLESYQYNVTMTKNNAVPCPVQQQTNHRLLINDSVYYFNSGEDMKRCEKAFIMVLTNNTM